MQKTQLQKEIFWFISDLGLDSHRIVVISQIMTIWNVKPYFYDKMWYES